MNDDESLPTEPSSQGRRRSQSRSPRSKKKKSKSPSFLKKFKVEIFGAVLLLLGAFLLLEKLEIRATLFSKFATVARALGGFFSRAFSKAREIEFSDFIGLLLILGGIFLIGLRVRSRVIGSQAEHGAQDKCPLCGESMRRAHGKLGHQILAFLLFVRIKRYTCRKCPGRTTTWESKQMARIWK